MIIPSPLFIDVQKSELKLYFFVVVHVLALLSILLISYSGLSGAALKVVLALAVVINFKRCLSFNKNNISFSMSAENLIDLKVGKQSYHDLQLSADSFISGALLQLIFLDASGRVVQNVTIFPDAIDAATHSQLRARLKVTTNQEYGGLA